MTAYVYMVECADDTLYTGWATDVERRVKTHNAGRGARYTRQRGPVRLVYVEEWPDRRTAMQRELEIKRMSRARKLRLIAKNPVRSTLLESTGGNGGDSPSHPPSSKNVGHISAD